MPMVYLPDKTECMQADSPKNKRFVVDDGSFVDHGDWEMNVHHFKAQPCHGIAE